MKYQILLSSGVLGLFLNAAAQNPPTAAPPPAANATGLATPAQPPPAVAPATTVQAAATNSVAEQSATNAPATPPPVEKPASPPVKLGPNEVLLNFRNAPIESVLKYLSEAAGFIINVRTSGELRGKLTVFSNHPITREEALEQLNSALDQNGYTAVRNGRTLTIFNKEDAKRQEELPVKVSSKPAEIPKNGEMVTQIIPLHYISAVQVSRDLQTLLPEKATMTANEGGNSVIITDTQNSIHRMAEIISALDTAISSVSSVRVFQLHYADAKALASVIKDLFAPQETARTGGNAQGANRFQAQFRGGGAGGGAAGGFPGIGGGGAGGGGGDASGGRASTPRVMAVADERSNSVVVSAPEEQMPVIVDLIQQVDTNVEDITELRVFRLHYADAQETADLLSSLFSTSSSGSNNNNNNNPFRNGIQFAGGRFGGPFGGNIGGGGGNRGSATTADSTRLQKQSQVVAVADLRTGSVVVSASRDLMKQIEGMVRELDMDPAKKQQVYVFDFQNTDPAQAVTILQSLFPNQSYGANSSNARLNQNQAGTGNQLNTRATQNQNTFGRSSSSGMGSGLGGSSLGSGLGR